MPPHDNHGPRAATEWLRSSLAMLAFGLGILAFLVAIDRPEWFHIRPATGTATAMSAAANPPRASSDSIGSEPLAGSRSL